MATVVRSGWLAALLFLSFFALDGVAHAQREHTVRSGQSLARVARRYEVSVTSLAAANGLSRDAQLRPGQVLRIPERGVHYVARGDTLASIARDHECSVRDLRRLNRLRDGSTLRIGQRLRLPGFDASEERQQAARRWGEPRHPGVAVLYRRTLDRRLRVRLVDSRGRARRVARRRLREMMRPRLHGRNGRLGPLPPTRLVEILARVSDHFGGRQITIVSGYRHSGGNTRESSRHTQGHALDIRVRGVPNHAVRDYLRSFDRVGVGFYPRSHFVHIDVRDRSAYWVDWSRPGEAPRYQRRGQAAPGDATREQVRSAGMGGDDGAEEAGEGSAALEDEGPGSIASDGDENDDAESDE
ncbi:MAG: LysM peptidoglycan-binding domain-containing protein [Sandaracinaceae bacterium]|nr:MAG: LysM peptidoglycan-binding domain-containing protein [Sandaracinaceae bacterium]